MFLLLHICPYYWSHYCIYAPIDCSTTVYMPLVMFLLLYICHYYWSRYCIYAPIDGSTTVYMPLVMFLLQYMYMPLFFFLLKVVFVIVGNLEKVYSLISGGQNSSAGEKIMLRRKCSFSDPCIYINVFFSIIKLNLRV